MWRISLLLPFLALVPSVAFANVRVNEIAWMGGTDINGKSGASNEWIELYNDGAVPVDLSGWVLAAADGTPQVALTGPIGANGYFLLERTDDDSVPGIKADQIYSGGLENGGETLALRDAKGIEIDRVEGGTNWSAVGGSNSTKETAGRVSSGWATATPTPRSLNVQPPPKVEPEVVAVSAGEAGQTGGNGQPESRVVVSTPVPKGNGSVWYAVAGVAVLVGLGIAASFFIKKDPVDEYTIIEETDE